MKQLLGTVVLMTLVGSVTTTAQRAACRPPPEWGASRKIGDWSVQKSCSSGVDTLSVSAGSDAGQFVGFAFLCDNEDGPRGMFSLNKVNLDGPMSVSLKEGTAPPLALEGLGMAGQATLVHLQASSETKRFEAALVDGSTPTFTVVLTQQGKPPLELKFSRTGLAAAVKPLRTQCGW
jgi:hypothetical protein